MSGLPMGWIERPLDEVCQIHNSEREPINADERESRIAGKDVHDLFPYYGATGQVGLIDAFRSEGQRVLLGEDGAPFLDPMRPKAYIAFGRYWVNNHAHVLCGVAGVMSNELLSHQLNVFDFHDYVTGSTRLKLTSSALKRIPLRVPPYAEQERIVAKLDELLSDLDAGVAELKAAQQKLQRYRQSLLKAAVEGALTAEWRRKNPPTETGADLLQRILRERRARWEEQQLAKFAASGKAPPKGWKDKSPEPQPPKTEGLPELPEGWVWASCEMLGELASGVAKGSKLAAGAVTKSVPYLRVANVQRGYLDLSEVKTIEATDEDIAALSLMDGDVLFNEGGDRDKLGRGWVWREQVRPCIHQNHVFRLRLYACEMQSEFVSHHGNSFGKRWFQNAGKQTTNLASINLRILRSFPIPVPPADEQREILQMLSEQIEAIDRQSYVVEGLLTHSAAQRQNILRAAFRGELVPQDPNDEPASVLLERLRAERSGTKPAKTERKTRKAKGAA